MCFPFSIIYLGIPRSCLQFVRSCEALLLVPKKHLPPWMVATELISLRIAPHGQAWGGQHTISPPPLPIFRCTLQDQIPRKSCPPSWAAGDVFLGSWTFRDTSHSSHAEDAVAAWTPPANPLSPFALWQVFFFLKHSQTSQQVFCKGWVSPIPLFF